MSNSALQRLNRGCYSNPFSGVGMEFHPLGAPVSDTEIRLHETGYLTRNDWWVFPHTLSPFWRLYYNFDAGHRVEFPNRSVELTPGSLVLIPDHQVFDSVGRVAVRHLWLTFSVARLLDSRQSVPIVLEPSVCEKSAMQELAREFTNIAQGNRNRIYHMSLALLHIVLSRSEVRWKEIKFSEGVHRALELMELSYAKPLDASQLARAAGMSVRGFSKAFNRQQGVAPGKFLTRIRVREAANLMANSAWTIDQIAEKTGFPNRYYFSRIFKRLTGQSPAQFRRNLGGGASG